MSDREKLIELIWAHPCDGKECVFCEHNLEFDCEVVAMADKLLANGVTIQKWVSVEDRLPGEGEVVMCRHKALQNPVFCQWDESDLCWVNNSWTFGRGVITHWMPLPEPPNDSER